MLRLILVRHAKSAWGDTGLADFDRPLARRGRIAATWIGETLDQLGLAPHRILCSPARRTRETLDLALAGLPAAGTAETTFSAALYNLRDEDYVAFVAEHGGEAPVLMLVGHNTATADTAAALSATGRAGDLAALADFPTGGIAVIDFDIGAWAELRAGTGHLVHFARPPKA